MINIITSNTFSAKKIHFDNLQLSIKQKIHNSRLSIDIKNYLNKNLQDVITGSPIRLLELHNEFNDSFDYLNLVLLKNQIKNIFSYKNFINKNTIPYNAYNLMENIDIRVCPYCNRDYTITVKNGSKINEQIIRPEIDHFFSQTDYPLLSLSFYNLIPSCHICNSVIKGKKNELTLENSAHPYIHQINQLYNFTVKPLNSSGFLFGNKGVDAKIIYNEEDYEYLRAKKNLEFFKIEEIYKCHSEEIQDLVNLAYAYNKSYLDSLIKQYHLNISEDEILRFVFGIYIDEASSYKRPFTKLKKDILKEMGIL
jgi:hypothetical protein